jgi:phosphate transport system substrate-binding protein
MNSPKTVKHNPVTLKNSKSSTHPQNIHKTNARNKSHRRNSMYANRMNNDMAVSPIVATLVLIVVAVIGAVAVGTIMGTFSSDVSKQASAGNAADAASTDLIVTGSSTMYPVIFATAANYTVANPSINVKVSSSGSGAGLAAVVQDVADLGMMSEDLTATQTAAYPNIKRFQVGVSGVVVIQKIAGTFGSAPLTDLYTIYSTGAAPASGNLSGVTGAVTRSDKSGTADVFGKMIGLPLDDIYKTPGAGFIVAAKSNSGVVGEITKAATANTVIGFTDYDYVRSNSAVRMIPYHSGSTVYANPSLTTIKDAWNGISPANTGFPKDATRPLNFVTNGEPSTLAKNFIQFNQMPDQKQLYNDIGIVHISEIVKA